MLCIHICIVCSKGVSVVYTYMYCVSVSLTVFSICVSFCALSALVNVRCEAS